MSRSFSARKFSTSKLPLRLLPKMEFALVLISLNSLQRSPRDSENLLSAASPSESPDILLSEMDVVLVFLSVAAAGRLTGDMGSETVAGHWGYGEEDVICRTPGHH